MSTRISSRSIRTTVPSTTSPCLKLRMSASCSARSSSIVVGSARRTTGTGTSSTSGSSAAGASATSASVTASGSGAAGAGGSLVSIVAAAVVSAGSSAIATPAACSDAWSATGAVASVSGVVPPVCSSVKICLLWLIVALEKQNGLSRAQAVRRSAVRGLRALGPLLRSGYGSALNLSAQGPGESSTRASQVNRRSARVVARGVDMDFFCVPSARGWIDRAAYSHAASPRSYNPVMPELPDLAILADAFHAALSRPSGRWPSRRPGR